MQNNIQKAYKHHAEKKDLSKTYITNIQQTFQKNMIKLYKTYKTTSNTYKQNTTTHNTYVHIQNNTTATSSMTS